MRSLLISSLVFQGVAIAVVLFVPFGFDHPSKFGLDFGHFLLLLVAHTVALVIGIVSAIARRQVVLAVGQFAASAILVALALCGVIPM